MNCARFRDECRTFCCAWFVFRKDEGYSDRVESYGLDECWVDMTDSSMDIERGRRLADEIRRRAIEELGITVSVGVSTNKAFAKLGSDMKKPNGTTVIPAAGFERVIWHLPASDLLFVGPSTMKKFIKWNILTIGDLANADTEWLSHVLGKSGMTLQSFALGLDTAPVANSDADIIEKSIGNSTTTPRDMADEEDVKCVLYMLAECVSSRLRRGGFRCRTISLGVRTKDLTWYGTQKTIRIPTNLTDEIATTALALFREHDTRFFPLRSVGIHCENLVPEAIPIQIDMFHDIKRRERAEKLEHMVDDITMRFGRQAIHRGIVYHDKLFAQLGPVDDHVGPATRNA